MKTIFLDVDGCVLRHRGEGACVQWSLGAGELLPGVREKLDAWEKAGYCVVLVTSRRECCRLDLERHLRALGLFWDQLIMGIPHGERVLVNDAKQGGAPSARAVVLGRNLGLGGLEI